MIRRPADCSDRGWGDLLHPHRSHRATRVCDGRHRDSGLGGYLSAVWRGSHINGRKYGLRFPGQWFQSESGLHQNWMRDYDPTTGRYIQADPLGLVDGASVYGYALQNPGRHSDADGQKVVMVCRPLDVTGGTALAMAVSAAQHCAVFVVPSEEECGCLPPADADGIIAQFSLSKPNNRFDDPAHPSATYFADRNAYLNPGSFWKPSNWRNRHYVVRPKPSMTSCQLDQAVLLSGPKYSQGVYSNGWGGENSNTAAYRLIQDLGGIVNGTGALNQGN